MSQRTPSSRAAESRSCRSRFESAPVRDTCDRGSPRETSHQAHLLQLRTRQNTSHKTGRALCGTWTFSFPRERSAERSAGHRAERWPQDGPRSTGRVVLAKWERAEKPRFQRDTSAC